MGSTGTRVHDIEESLPSPLSSLATFYSTEFKIIKDLENKILFFIVSTLGEGE